MSRRPDDDDESETPRTSRNSEWHMIAGQGFQPAEPPVKLTDPKLPAGIYDIVNMGMLGTVLKPHEIKADDTVRIPDGKASEVIGEIQRFWSLKDRFKKFGYLHKRGFLLHGSPGTGKTVTLGHIMEDMVKRDGVVILAPHDSPETLIDMLRSAREVEPERPFLVVLEDLDNLIRYGEVKLLSLLDGEHAIENVVYLATTNFLARLPDRIVNRPSRFDKKIEIGPPGLEARKLYLQSRGIEGEQLETMATKSKGLSMAQLKELIISVEILENPLEGEVKRLMGKDLSDPKDDDE